MDAKGRVSIPAGLRMELQAENDRPPLLRMELQAENDRPPFLTSLVDCPALGLYSRDRWLEIEHRLENMSQAHPGVQSYRRLVISGAVESPFDAQGRVLVPPHLREHAGLEREVTIAGVGSRIEIWDKARFDEELQQTRERSQEISSLAAELGL
jgi:MraZ protein